MTARAGTAADADVIVVGAGPVGLFLACELRRHAVRVSVVEQLTAPSGQSRASTLHARTMELFARADLLAPLGPPVRGGSGHFAGLPLDLTAADPTHPFAGLWKAPQTGIEDVLARRAVDTGAVLLRGHRLTGLTQHPDHVTVEVVENGVSTSMRCAFLVGCDGEHSTVRVLAGLDFPDGRGATRELLRADVVGIDIPDRRFQRLPDGLAIASRGPDGVTRVMMHEYGSSPQPDRAPDFADVVATWQRLTGEDIGHGRPLWVNAFDDACVQVPRYRAGRVLLAGDAAHLQLPVGGQAINLGLQDAADLGDKLSRQFGDQPDDGLLDTYHDSRHDIVGRALTQIRAQAALLLGGPEVDPLRDVVAELTRIPQVRRTLAAAISGLDHRSSAEDRRHTMERLTGRTALVTGASRGIGAAVALRLAREGALVAVHYGHDDTAAKNVVEAIERDGGAGFAVRAELGVPGDVDELFAALDAELTARTGSTDLHILVNNAGVMGGVAPEDVQPADFDRLHAINAKAPFFITQRALRSMPDGGRIVNISSGLTRFANPQEIAYAMTKGAIDQLTMHLAKHLGPRGITVNSVGPGITDNGGPLFDIPAAVEQMAQLSVFGTVGKAADIAAVVAFLASDDGRWITGSYLDASGGTLLGGQPGR